MTEDEMIGWHHRLSGHEFEQTPGDSEGQGSPVCCCPRGPKESDTTERLTVRTEVQEERPLKILWIIETARGFQKNLYFCVIDYAKAFDCVDHNKPWEILRWVYQTT